MILDAIIAILMAIFAPAVAVTGSVAIFVVNLVLAAIEAVVGIFISGFSLTRMEKSKKGSYSKASAVAGGVFLAVVLVGVAWVFLGPKIMSRTVTLVAEDGHSLPFAAVVIATKQGNEHERADKSGNITFSRFGTQSMSVKDPRYVEKTWLRSEFNDELIVERTILGSGLDSLAEKLLKRAKK